MAGADRLKLTEHIAFDDLLALARFALYPDDDLNLAALLRSPLLRCATRTASIALAHGRGRDAPCGGRCASKRRASRMGRAPTTC